MKSFEEILSEKLNTQILKTYNPLTEVDKNEPQNLAYLIGQLPKWSIPSLHRLKNINQYAKRHSPRTEEILVKKEISRTPDHTLNPEQLKALKYFTGLGVSLALNFSKDELRSAFRKLALQVHPDRQPETQKEKATRIFQDLKTAYEKLKNL
jgi:hypothetical protein